MKKDTMTSKQIIEGKIAKKLRERQDKVNEIGVAVAVSLIGDDGGRWVIDCAKNPVEVHKDETTKVKMTIKMKDEDFAKLVKGDLNPQMAFLFGKIKIDGDVGLAIKLGKLLT